MDAKFDMACKFGLVLAIMNIVFNALSIITVWVDALLPCFACIRCLSGCAGIASLVQLILGSAYAYSASGALCMDQSLSGPILWYVCTIMWSLMGASCVIGCLCMVCCASAMAGMIGMEAGMKEGGQEEKKSGQNEDLERLLN